ncbi:hypothetical protein ABPG74_004065 [Tetrahymena malaccensis]
MEQDNQKGALVKKQWFIKSNSGRIDDFYEWSKKRTLGSGQFGSVVSCKLKGTNDTRAIKVIPKSRVRDPQQFLNEINIMKELDHPNVIRLYETFEDQRNVYLSMELCQGGELFDVITAKKKFNEEEARLVFNQIVSAVSYCHANNICHRDLKPENFLLLQKDSLENIKVADFGLSCIFVDKQQKKQDIMGKTGSSYYMAPEVLQGVYNELCDVWSLGVILYILLSGIPPFFGSNDSKIFEKIEKGTFSFDFPQFQNVSDNAKDLIRKCLVPQDQRLKANEVLKHPWCINEQKQSVNLNIDVGNLKSFTSNSKLKKVALTFIASQLSETEIIDLGKQFKQLDKNGDGVLSIEEITEGMKNFDGKQSQLLEIIKEIDTDKNGQIEYSEFIAASMDKQLYMKQEKLYQAFKALDIDGSGSISKDELKQVLDSEDHFMNHSADFWNNVIKEADKDGNGEIDYDEFVEMMVPSQSS